MGRRGLIRLAAVAVIAAVACLAVAPAASADLTTLLLQANCTVKHAGPSNALPYRFCNDGVPDQGGTTPNVGAVKAVPVPAKYTGAGQPTKAPDAEAKAEPGADPATGDIALDVDLSLPDPATFPTGPYPVVVMMHGCCAGDKTSWEGNSIDDGGEKWHYNNAWFASRGYVVVNYTARGFVNGDNKGSTGQTQLDSDLYEINDFQHLVGQLVDKGDLDSVAPGAQSVDPQKVVVTGGSYGGGFSWMALTDPAWHSPGGGATPIKLAAAAPKYGWTDLIESLVPDGLESENGMRSTDAATAHTNPLGFPKRSINAALYASGKTGVPPGTNHTTFPPEIDQAMGCLQSPDPYESNPACTTTLSTTLPRFLNERSAFYENTFFAGLTAANATPVFSAGTLTDNLFPPAEHRRMVERLKATVPSGYPVQEYYGDYQHFVQNKAKEWGDLCAGNHHVCTYADYPDDGSGGKDLNAVPDNLAREVGATTRLNRFIDHYTTPQRNPSQGTPAKNVTASLQVCPQNATAAFPADEPGERFTAATFNDLAPNTLAVGPVNGAQRTANKTAPNTHAVRSDPIENLAQNGGKCPVEQTQGGAASAGPGVATYDSNALTSDFTMLGQTKVTVQHTGAGPGGFQLNARLYDLFPDGSQQVMVDRGVSRIKDSEVDGTTAFYLHGNGWKFPKGHRIRIELAQDDDPYIKASNQPSSMEVASARLDIPVRETGTGIGGRVPPPSSSQTSGGSSNTTADSGFLFEPLVASFGSVPRTITVRHGRFFVRCRAGGAGRRVCRVSALRNILASRLARLGSGRKVIWRRSARVRVKLNRRGWRLLRKHRRHGLRVRLRIRVRDGGGRVGTAQKRVRLKPRRRR
jgi:acetyl esterase/lipase